MASINKKIVVAHHCDNCGAYMELNSDQRHRQRKKPDSKFYCDNECHIEDRERNNGFSRGPWAHLNVKTVLNCLPTEEPPEIWVGY